jgi:uncharacterized protein (DUF362 family)
MLIHRRSFLGSLAAPLVAADGGKSRVGLVQSTHPKLPTPVSPEDPLDYAKVRDMVWKAIEYAPPRAGSLEAKIPAGSWVVVKPNLVFLRPQGGYAPGDITDMRVLKAVLEYVARRSRARRITVAEGGSYRGPQDPLKDNAVTQNGVRVGALAFDWGADEFPGFNGSLGGMLEEFTAAFPGKKFDYVDLSYDAIRDAAGQFRRIQPPRAPNGVGAFSLRPDYYATRTITGCDFLISMPVMKVHDQSAITCCFKNYVGTAPREAYSVPGRFWNVRLHDEHEVDDRIDHLIVDLAAFHPPDYNIVDGIRGLQYSVHNNRRPDQTVRSNLVLAGEDTVAVDALAGHLVGFQVHDMEFLHLARQRGLGTMDFQEIDVRGDDPERLKRRWAKPRPWWGRCNREWRVTRDAASDLGAWRRYTSATDTLELARAAGEAPPEAVYGAAVRVRADGHRKAFLWMGLRGRVTGLLNGEKFLEEENRTRYRVGQIQKPVELRSGENLLVFRVQGLDDPPRMSVLLVNPRNDGDSVEGIRWEA